MSVTVSLSHNTFYRYPKGSQLSPQLIRLRPAPHTRTTVLSYNMKVTPEKHFINWQQDPFGNHVARVVFPEPVDNFSVEVDLAVDLVAINPFDFFLEEQAEEVPFAYGKELSLDLLPYLKPTEKFTGELSSWLDGCAPNGELTVPYLLTITAALAKLVSYEIRYEPGVQSCAKTMERKAGSCRDSAWLLVETLRHLGYAARFVSGYLVQLVPDSKPLSGPAGPEKDFTDLHAWAEVYLPGAGWVGLDPTSGLAAGEGHIPLVATPMPQGAAPITGTSSETAIDFRYENNVTRVQDDPRSTKPYSDKQWSEILALGETVDSRLAERNVRLTIGGEPTFVSATDSESDQWNTAADGKDKRQKADELARRLAKEFGHGTLLQKTQGKWYPGEELPRWQYNLIWRKDGKKLWSDPALLNENKKTSTVETAKKFADELSKQLQMKPDAFFPAYEDPLYGLWREASLPKDYDIDPGDMSTKEQRQKVVASFDAKKSSEPVGYVVPLDRFGDDQFWSTSPWPLQRSHVFLIPGSSPLGMRLPLDSLPESKEEKPEPTHERDPAAPVDPFIETAMKQAQICDDVVVRKALAVEVREGLLYVFLPPFDEAEHSVDLIAAIEKAATATKTPVVIEGYPLPHDSRLQSLSVTPDPGVIEVNIHPASSFSELNAITSTVYEAARQTGLATEKFHLDGRHSGTGGGNHITLGGPTPKESPLLADPQLLTSIVTYWQHHPALSYLFSGLFVGPTSQAPRVDEARLENLHELEIALGEINDAEHATPWLADRALRHLLTDLTGNTHRAELCIDKLYSPDHSRGRLGLLELRAFEMPPHKQMAMVTYLLVQALVDRLSRDPYQHSLIRWGSDLHDRFLLPHYLAQDMADIVKDLAHHDLRFDLSWFEPFFNFRFPRYGTIVAGPVALELRAAIEPWLVLGEESNASATARYVDSSMERLQVKATGLQSDRYAVLVNGQPLPLRATSRSGEHVAGVKYRAWQPSSALHPTIGVHSPLLFQVVDKVTSKAIGAAKYHVAHPGGRSYDKIPVNSLEAESRRQNRFEDSTLVQQGALSQTQQLEKRHAFTATQRAVSDQQGSVEPVLLSDEAIAVPQHKVGKDFPTTLDLRSS